MNKSKRRREATQGTYVKGPSGQPDPRGSRRARRHPAPAVAPHTCSLQGTALHAALEAQLVEAEQAVEDEAWDAAVESQVSQEPDAPSIEDVRSDEAAALDAEVGL